MKKLHELLGKKKPIPGDIGLEIEYEGTKFQDVLTDVWKTVDDGSLRGLFPTNRGEYVLNRPIPSDRVKDALNDLKAAIPNAVPNFSFRTSVHVHVNVQDMDEEQVISFIYAALLLEEPLVNFCGNTRKGNRFCLRIQDADFSLHTLSQMFRNGFESALRFTENHIRYAAINLASLKKYGSIEFRSMRGTLDADVLSTWALALVSIRNFACHQKSCLDVHDEFVRRGPRGFLEHVLGELAVHFVYKNLEKDMYQSFSLTLELPYEYKYNKEKRLKAQENKEKANEAAVKMNVANIEAVVNLNPQQWVDFERAGAVFQIPPAAPVRKVRRAAAVIVNDIEAAPVDPEEEVPNE